MYKHIKSISFILYLTILIIGMMWLVTPVEKHTTQNTKEYKTIEEIMQTPVKNTDTAVNFDTEFKSSIQPIEEKHGN